MLEQIHAASEDQRKRDAIVSLSAAALGAFTLFDAVSAHSAAGLVLGSLFAATGLGYFAWAMRRKTASA